MENKKKSPEKKGLKVLIVVLLSLVGLVALVILGFRGYMMLPVMSYYQASEKAFQIPGLDENFIPQGFFYDEERGLFLVSGYSAEKEASPVYLLDAESGEAVGKVLLHKTNGDKFTGHSGGIARWGDYVYIAGGSGKCLYIYSYADILSAERDDAVTCLGKFSLKASDEDYLGASFVSVIGDRLVVGEFRAEPDYPYPDSHKVTTSAGDSYGGLALEFALSSNAAFGILPTPVGAYSIRDKVQGICIDDGMIYLSTSLGLSHSHIYAYEEAKLSQEGTIDIIGYRDIPLYALDSASLVATYKAPPMAEEMVMVDGKLHIMCESASSKFLFGKLIGGKWCYRTDLSGMKSE